MWDCAEQHDTKQGKVNSWNIEVKSQIIKNDQLYPGLQRVNPVIFGKKKQKKKQVFLAVGISDILYKLKHIRFWLFNKKSVKS